MNNQASQKSVSSEVFKASLAQKADLTGQLLSELLGEQNQIPSRLRDAMDYMLQSGGKRIRAALVMWACETAGGRLNRDAQIAAAAVEMVHTYSLIHDDLPAMDNDDMRRGRPSCHKQFDEATAILAGDALLTLAFEILSAKIEEAEIAVRMIRTLSRAAGPSGMIAGQAADMQYANAGGTLASLEYIHTNKTGAMFAASAALGAIAARASDPQIQALLEYGMKIGLGFQIADDLLDITATSAQLGKTAGKDAAQGKLTYPALVGVEKSREIFEKLTCQAIAAVETFGPRADILRQLARELLNRTQ